MIHGAAWLSALHLVEGHNELRPSRLLVVYGTRPEAIKLAPLILKLRAAPGLHPVVAVTGQHREMLDQVNELFGIVPDFDLDLGRPGRSLASMMSVALERLDGVLEEVAPDAVIVQGDTTSTLAGALAAFYRRVPVVHLEAGLRTGDRTSPFPEEANRLLVSRLTTLHLCATARNRDALLAEGIEKEDVCVIGNTVIDALLHTANRELAYTDPSLEFLETDPRQMILVTAHRRESWGEGMTRIGSAIATLARDRSLVFVIPVHKNPIVRRDLLGELGQTDNVVVVEPADYVSFVKLMARSHIILTDSGGVQEEAPALGKPLLVLREETERVEVIEVGAARLVGTDTETIVSTVRRLLHDDDEHASMSGAGSPFGDGVSADRATSLIGRMLGRSSAPLAEMSPRPVWVDGF